MGNAVGTASEAMMKNMFDQLPPERQEAILQELSSGWLQTEAADPMA